jgi:hypothetical protein
MAKRTITIIVDGATDAQYATLANDVWARLSDPPSKVGIAVQIDGSVSLLRLNNDFARRYGGTWSSSPQGPVKKNP